MLRVVVDVNVVVSGLINYVGPPAAVLKAVVERKLRLVASPELVGELDRVLHKPQLRRWFSLDVADRTVLDVRRVADMHYPPDLGELGVTRDPNDDYIVHLYRYASADVLCTGDVDLRDAGLPDVRVLTPAELVAALGRCEDDTR